MRIETTERENANLVTAKKTTTAYEITGELTKDEMAAIHGGAKARAKGDKIKYLEVKMEEVIISN